MSLVVLPIGLLLVGAVLELACARFVSNVTKGRLAMLSALAALLAALAMLPGTARGAVWQADLPGLGAGGPLSLYVDGLSMLFILLATGLGAAILLYAIRYMEHEPAGVTRFYLLMLIFIAGLVLLVSSANLLVAYVAWEVIGLCSYFLIGFWYTSSAATNGARKVLLITHLSGYGLLVAVVLLYVHSGTFLWTDPAVARAFTTGIALLMIVAAMAKSVLYPLHTWIPEAMNAPTPVSALLHSACYVKAGVYLIARMYSIGPWQAALGDLLLVVGCATMFIGAVFALAQTDLKRLLAYSTVSQLGYIATGLALGTGLGVAAGLLYVVSHALFKGTLFLCAGSVQHATGTRDLRKLGGLSSRMPVTTVIWLIAAASIVGVPLTTGFVAKWLLFDAALEDGQMLVMLVAWIVSILTAFYFLKATVSVFFGNPPTELRQCEVNEAPRSMLVGMGILATLCIVLGVAPQLVLDPVVGPAVRSLGFDWQVQMTWFGVLTDSGAVGVTAGAAVAVVGLGVGLGVYQTVSAPRVTPVLVFTGGDPLPEDDQLSAVDFAALAEENLKPVYALTPDPLYLAAWRWLLDAVAALQRVARDTLERHPFVVAVVSAVLLGMVAWLG
jgi:multicomponent Na+:H+ antiporter subunit A